MTRKIFVLLSGILIIALLFFYHEPLLNWIKTTEREYIVLTTIIATSMSLFPVIPYPILGGIIGAAYGPLLGGVMIWTGSTLASVIFFSMVRYGGFHKWGTKILLKYSITKKITLLFERNAFMSITIMRMIPIIPSILVNAYSALSRVSFVSYFIASGLGKIPAMTLFSLVGHTIITNPRDLLYMILIYGVFLGTVSFGYKAWTKRIEAQLSLPKKAPTLE